MWIVPLKMVIFHIYVSHYQKLFFPQPHCSPSPGEHLSWREKTCPFMAAWIQVGEFSQNLPCFFEGFYCSVPESFRHRFRRKMPQWWIKMPFFRAQSPLFLAIFPSRDSMVLEYDSLQNWSMFIYGVKVNNGRYSSKNGSHLGMFVVEFPFCL